MTEEAFYKQSTLPHIAEAGAGPTPLPESIGPYKIESLLTKGGMSLLYLGRHPESTLPLVIKVLSPQYLAHQEMIEHFLKEAKIIGLTDHPNIVKLFGQGEWEKGLYIAMEFIQGISLRQFIVQQSLSLRRALEIILQVAYALLHLHTHGVIHRDLKPENILITENGQVKVIDFGIAQLTYDDKVKTPSSLGRFVGTPSYMSPEQKRDFFHVDFPSDIYALGVVTYELAVGKLSFGTIEFGLLPQGLRTIVAKAVAPSLKDRYPDIVDFITDVAAYIKELSSQKEAPDIANLQEVWETLGATHKKILTPPLPKWNRVDIGLSVSKSLLLLDLYYDFFKLPDGTLLHIMAQAKERLPNAIVQSSLIGGMIRALIGTAKEGDSFSPGDFVTKLNALLAQNGEKKEFGLACLHMNPLTDEFSFISCGTTPLWHLTQSGTEPRLLLSRDPLLGSDPAHTFYEVNDSWLEGDTLLYHSFSGFDLDESAVQEIEDEYKKVIIPLQQLSCQSQADAILKSVHENAAISPEKQPRAVVSIQRLA